MKIKPCGERSRTMLLLFVVLFAANCFAQEQPLKDIIAKTDTAQISAQQMQYYELGKSDAKKYKNKRNKNNPNINLINTNTDYTNGFCDEANSIRRNRITIMIFGGIVVNFVLLKIVANGLFAGM